MSSKSWLLEAERIDVAAYAAVARAPTPRLDRGMARLSDAANYSRVSMGVAGALAVFGGPKGRSAAVSGLRSIAVTSAVINLAIKPLVNRPRPDRAINEVPEARQVEMPVSRSFPSGHSASAFAFAAGTARVMPSVKVPLFALATLVAYSRVHTGVHYPGDALAGSALGAAIGALLPPTPAGRAGLS